MVTPHAAQDFALEFNEPSPAVDREGTRQPRLNRADLDLVRTKRRDATRLGFAVLLLHFTTHCRFPRTDAELEPGLVADVMAQLGIATASTGTIELMDRTAERHRAEIRSLLGFREATVVDGAALTEWLRDHPKSANVQLILHFAHPGITLLACYFMFRAKNWARWLYVLCNGLLYGTALALLADDHLAEGFVFLRLTGAMVPGVIFLFIALIVLFRRDAREYFAVGGRPWWKREQEKER